jgi:uncharacterized protein YecT (DUF1311 family)
MSFLLLAAAPKDRAPDCANQQTQWDMTVCASEDYQRADQALNVVWKQALERQDRPGRAELRNAQRAWLKFRAAECRFQAGAVRGGSAESMVHTGCLAQLTRERTEQIRPRPSER